MLYICIDKNYTYYGQDVDNYEVVIVHVHTNVYNICEWYIHKLHKIPRQYMTYIYKYV